MSLTSYRAAPPRGSGGGGGDEGGRRPGPSPAGRGEGGRLADLAATYSPTPSWRSTMGAAGFHGRVRDGSGGAPALSATRSGKRPAPPARPRSRGPGGAGAGGPASRAGAWTGRAAAAAAAAAAAWGAVAAGGSRSIGRLGPVSFARRRACTPGLSTWWSATALIARPGLEGGFPLRCLQRLSRPSLATRRRGGRHDRSTRGSSTPVLSYWGQLLASLEHPRQIGTELSHDVLNPAHVPL